MRTPRPDLPGGFLSVSGAAFRERENGHIDDFNPPRSGVAASDGNVTKGIRLYLGMLYGGLCLRLTPVLLMDAVPVHVWKGVLPVPAFVSFGFILLSAVVFVVLFCQEWRSLP